MHKSNNNNNTIAKVAAVMAVGTAAYMLTMPKNSNSNSRKQKDLKKSASTAIKNAGVIVDSISQMLG